MASSGFSSQHHLARNAPVSPRAGVVKASGPPPATAPRPYNTLNKSQSSYTDSNSTAKRPAYTLRPTAAPANPSAALSNGPTSPTKLSGPPPIPQKPQFDYASVRAQFEQLGSANSTSSAPKRPLSRKFVPGAVSQQRNPPGNRVSRQLPNGIQQAPGPAPTNSPYLKPTSAPQLTTTSFAPPALNSSQTRPLPTRPAASKSPAAPPRPLPAKQSYPSLPAGVKKAAPPKLGFAKSPAKIPAGVKKAPSRPLPTPTPVSPRTVSQNVEQTIEQQPDTPRSFAPPEHVAAVPPADLSPVPQLSLTNSYPADDTQGLLESPINLDSVATEPVSQPQSPIDRTTEITPRGHAAMSRARRPAVSHQDSSASISPRPPVSPHSDSDTASQVPIAPMAAPAPQPAGRKRAQAILPSAQGKIVIASPELDRPIAQQNATPTVARRYVVKEIVETEEVFVQDVLKTISMYLAPLRTMPKLISAVEIGKLFANIEMIMITSSEMAKELRQAFAAAQTPEDAQIGAVFSKNATTLESAFAQYCRANSEALQLLGRLQKKSAFSAALESLEANDPAANGLLSLLVKPVQRVCKYPLLLRELQKHTPEAHPDFESVGVALSVIGRLVDKVNMTAKETENISNLLRVEAQLSEAPAGLKIIAPGRRFIREGRWMKISGRNTQERQVYLFNDMLIYAKPAVLSKNKFVFKGVVPLHDAKFEAHGDPGTQLANSMKITRSDNNKVYILFDENEEEDRDEWLADISSSLSTDVDVKNVVGAFHIAEVSPDARKDAVTVIGIETRISGWVNDNPQRRFIASGPMKYVSAGASDSSSDTEHRAFLFLFHDCAVFAKQLKNVQSRVPFQYRETLDLSSSSVQDLDSVDLDGDKTVYQALLMTCPAKQRRLVMLFTSVDEKNKWLDLISARISEMAPADGQQSEAEAQPAFTQAYPTGLVRSNSTTSPTPKPRTSFSSSRSVSVSGIRLPAGISPRGAFAEAAGPTLKTKKSFFGKKLGYITDRRDSGTLSRSDSSAPMPEDNSEDSGEDPNEKRETVDGFEVPPWDSDDSADFCTACNTKFSATTRKHHCRNCGHLYCSKCTTKKCMLPRYGFTKKKVRVCDKCFINH